MAALPPTATVRPTNGAGRTLWMGYKQIRSLTLRDRLQMDGGNESREGLPLGILRDEGTRLQGAAQRKRSELSERWQMARALADAGVAGQREARPHNT
jgi:hypothetical protein